MLITKKHLPRRTFLRGVGVTLSLPFLDAMAPALVAQEKSAAKALPRVGFVYVPHGAIMDQWTPKTVGADFEFTRILKPLEPYRDYVNVVTGLHHKAADTTAVHSLSPTTWLSGVRPKPTQGEDALAGVTADQIAAQHIGQDTPLPSIELATEDHSGLLGECDRDYGCIYMNTLSWRTPTTPMPMEINPRKVFERMFGQGGSQADRSARNQEDRSILDAVTQEAADLSRGLGPKDRSTMSDYLENVREIERRVKLAQDRDLSGVEAPEIPVAEQDMSFDRQVRLLFDLIAVAYQADLTRVASYIMIGEGTNRTYNHIGVPDSFHPLSHHADYVDRLEKLVKIQRYHVERFAEFVAKLAATPDGEGTLLDNSMLLYGSNMSNSNLHSNYPLPNILVGGGAGALKGGRQIELPERTTISNLHLTLLNKAGLEMKSFGDSTGAIAGV